MILPASYQNGFAPRDGQPLYPSLGKGCVGAWNPGLGPTGLTLRDNSGFGNHGTLTNGPTFAASQGRYAMNFDGTNRIICGNPERLNPSAGAPWSICCWVFRNTNTSSYEVCLSKRESSSNTDASYVLVFNNTNISGTNKTFVFYSGGGATFSTTSVALTTWTHLACVSTASLTTYYMNGVTAGTSVSVVSTAGSSANFTIGANAGGTEALSGKVDDARVYNRALSPQEIRTLATRRGIAYEMAPRRRSSSSVAVTSYSTFRPSVLRGSR